MFFPVTQKPFTSWLVRWRANPVSFYTFIELFEQINIPAKEKAPIVENKHLQDS